MKKQNHKFHFLAVGLLFAYAANSTAQDSLYVRYDDRFKANGFVALENVDSISVQQNQLRVYNPNVPMGYTNRLYTALLPDYAGEFTFTDPGRYLLKPNTYSGTNYMNNNAASGYNFAHSVESEHYAVFWDVRYGDDPTRIQHPGDIYNTANAYNVLNIGERCWEKYCELGFLVPGQSTTDKYKIQLYIPYQSEWRADASGTDGVSGGKTGIGHFNPWAANARGGHTIAHEVGHTFQYLVSADLGQQHGFNYGYDDYANGGNGWWESCADWQAYKIFPERQFTDGEYFEGHLARHHLNLLHEDWRYDNCFIQDWWCMKHGADFIGRLWRESNKPEDPVEAYQRLCGITQAEFCDEQMEGYMRMATWDIDGVRDRAKHRIGQHKTFLNRVGTATHTWQSDVDHCIQNYGYTIINMNRPAAGTVVKADFTGLVGAAGYKTIYPERAGWRYAFVALSSDGTRTYGDVQKTQTGTATLTIPANCTNLFFVVMGAPTQHWRHPWDFGGSTVYPQNGEQWPFQVTFENTNLLGK